MAKRTKSLPKGVSYDARKRLYKARIHTRDARRSLGYFATAAEAAAAYRLAKKMGGVLRTRANTYKMPCFVPPDY